jgi:PAS domain S-box-containing protein
MGTITETARVLYVDDDPSFADMISTMLEREADFLTIETAETAERGLEFIRTETVDCVVSDYSMPETDGLEFLRAVRKEDEELPFLLLTGRGSEDIASEAITAGVTDYIQKQQGTEHYSLLANRIENAVEQYRAGEELERQKQELKNLKNRFQSFVKHSPDIITAIDEEGTIRYQSPAVERILGYEQQQRIGTKAIEHVHPDDRGRVLEGFYEIVNSNSEGRVVQEYRVKHADGSWIWLESIMSTGETHSEEDYVINSRDVTERKRRERELEQKTERLDEFAGIVSHDLQSPLMVADSRLSLAHKACECGGAIEHIEGAGDALDRMDEIIDATLTLAREGQIVDETERVDLADLADRCFKNVAPQETELELMIEALTLRADPDRLRHVLENLFANAVDHGGDTVTICIGETEGNGFYIADDGPGIPEEEYDEIFEPGYSMSKEGTGFGLAIVEEIVEAHGWDVEVTESVDGGARFEITDIEVV